MANARKRKRTESEGQAVVPVTGHDLDLHPMTDSGNAELIAAIYGDTLRFDHRQSRWLIWDKNRRRWSQDQSCTIRTFALNAARRRRKLAAKITDKDEANREFRWGFDSEDRYRLDAAIEIAKSLEPISDPGQGWDADPWLLGVANGVIDLRTGKLRAETQQDRITKHSPVEYDPSAECPRWLVFLCEIFSFDSKLVDYVWKAIGYSLTGSVQEQNLFCNYGLGANGKTTLAEGFRYISGDYAVNLPFSALELKNRNSNDLVILAGARFVTAAETNEGARLNEARIKSLTGGDPITARRLYHESFTFGPTHKLWLSVNHKPVIADDSEGMWRRVHLIPFTKQFKPEEQDKGLLDALKAEAAGILTWMVEGCLLWQKEGLGMPPAVAEATALYREESDHIGEFIGDCCIVEPDATITSGALWQGYQQWSTKNEEIQLSRQSFGERMEKHSFRRNRIGHKGTRVWVGIRLRREGETATADTLTPADANSDFFPIETSSKGSLAKSVSASVSTSAAGQPPVPNEGVTGKESPDSQAGEAGKPILEVEI